MFKDKKQALRCARQAAFAREFAQFKSRRQFRRQASGKKPYKPGSIGISAVSAEIKQVFGEVIPRRDRRSAGRTGKAFTAFLARR